MSVERSEESSHHHLTARQQSNSSNDVIRSEPWIKRRVQGTVGVKAGDAVSIRRVHGRKLSTDQNPPIGLQSHHSHQAGRTRSGTKARIERSISLQARNV